MYSSKFLHSSEIVLLLPSQMFLSKFLSKFPNSARSICLSLAVLHDSICLSLAVLHNDLYAFDPVTLTWIDLSSPTPGFVPAARYLLGFVALDAMLYAFAGDSNSGEIGGLGFCSLEWSICFEVDRVVLIAVIAFCLHLI